MRERTDCNRKDIVGPQIISVGEVLFDVFGDEELLAGAPLNVSAHLRRLGHNVAFLSGVGRDQPGDRALVIMGELGLSTEWITRSDAPTGRVDVVLRDGEPSYTIHRGVAYEETVLSKSALQALRAANPQWLYYGTLAQCSTTTRQTTEKLCAHLTGVRRFYDLNLRPGFSDPRVVRSLLEAATVVKLNKAELTFVCDLCGWPALGEEAFCRRLSEKFSLEAVCVTRGEAGAALLYGTSFFERHAAPIVVVDTVGAGDAFAAALLHGLCERWSPERIVHFGNLLGSHVATQRGAIPSMTEADFNSLINP